MKAALTLPSDIAGLPRLFEFAADFAGRNKLPDDEVSRLLLIIDEIFSNIVRYGFDGPDPGGTIELELLFARGRLQIVFSDDGRAFDPLAAAVADLDLPMAQRPIGGLGVHFVRNLVDDARYSRRNGHNRLVLIRQTVPPDRQQSAG
jgi:anti-sigma regulatory factor (Ser/Thr protein kinase)